MIRNLAKSKIFKGRSEESEMPRRKHDTMKIIRDINVKTEYRRNRELALDREERETRRDEATIDEEKRREK